MALPSPQSFLLLMLSFRSLLLALLAPALWPAPALHAQTTVARLADYTGPRYPGGPDSLRALVYRSVRPAGAAPAGRLLVRFELPDGSKPQKFRLAYTDQLVNSELVKAGTDATEYLQGHMLNWWPGVPTKAFGREMPQVSLALNFPAPSAANQAYAYADQPPVFASLVEAARAGGARSFRPSADPAPVSLIRFIQMLVRYPSAALRQNQQGTVYVYLEVTETGAIEYSEVVATAGNIGPEMTAEVMRVVAQLPAATAPAQVAGRPVRLYYVLPINFKIQ